MRVESPRPAESGGWFHPVDSSYQRPIPPKAFLAPVINCSAMLRKWQQEKIRPVDHLACMLRLESWALERFGVVWAQEHRAWAFPMLDGYGNAIGIRLRDDIGHKWAVRGSKQGIFIPAAPAQETVWITEGPTDAAAGLQLGLLTIGRPSCQGSHDQIATAIRKMDARRAVLLSDNDSPGYEGAQKLSKSLPVPTLLVCPPGKDIRQLVGDGSGAAVFWALTRGALWRQPKSNHG